MLGEVVVGGRLYRIASLCAGMEKDLTTGKCSETKRGEKTKTRATTGCSPLSLRRRVCVGVSIS